MNSNKQKPISIIVEEARQTIADAINSLHLSPTILEPIMKDIFQEVQEAHKNEYLKDIQLYSSKQEQENEE